MRQRFPFPLAAAIGALVASSAAAAPPPNGMQRIGAHVLSDSAYGGLYSAVIDPAGGYAYFGGKHGWVVKLDIKGALPVELGAEQNPSGQPNTALIDVASGHAYFLSGAKVDRVALGAGDDPPTWVDTLTLPGSSLAGVIDTSDPDPANHYAYFDCNGTPDQIVKVSLATFTVVGSAPLQAGETGFRRGVIDTTNGYAYFVGPAAEAGGPPIVVKVALGAGAAAPSRIGAVQLDATAHGMGSAVIDVAHGYAYFGTYFGANSVPATVFEVALGAGSAPPTLVSHVTLGAGTGAENGPDAAERELCTAVVDAGSGFAYFGTDHTYPAKIFQVSLGSGGAAPVETGMLQLVGGTQPVGEPNGPNDGENVINSPSSSYGEVFLQSSVVDPLRGYAYFGTDGYPGMIVKILLPTSAPVGACGDGVVQAGEQCDDGSANGTAGDCCSATCEFVAAGAPCADDGSACTSDVCDGAGACTHPVPAFAGCEDARAGGAVLRMKLGRTAKKDSLVWTWTGALASGDLGDPRGGTGYTLCVMETAADALGLVVDARAPAGGTCAGRPCWSAVAGGYDYRNRAPLAGALARATLRPRAGDRGTLRVVGKGAAIAMPARALGAPVLVRFQRDDAPVCWEATFPTPSRNDARAFRARSS